MPGHILDADTVALWRADETANNTPDLTTWQRAAGLSKRVLFDGVDNRVDIGDIPSLTFERTDAFSISIWFSTVTTGSGYLFTKALSDTTRRGWRLFITDTSSPGPGTLNFRLENNDLGPGFNRIVVFTSTGGLNDGKRHHVVVTYNGSSSASGALFYVDGALRPATTELNGNTLTATTLSSAIATIGDIDGTTSSLPFPGALEHASIWTGVLSLAEVGEVYGNGTPPDLLTTSMAANLLGWWKVDGSDNLSIAGGVTDHSGQLHDGTAVGGLGYYAPTLTRSPVVASSMPGIAGGPKRFIDANEATQDHCRWFSNFFGQVTGLTSPSNVAAIEALLGPGWTIEAWIYLDRVDALDQAIISYSASGETLATNYLGRMMVSAAGNLNIFWEFPTSTNFTANSTGLVPKQQWVHVAITGLENGANRDVGFFIAGAASGTASGTKAGGGTSSAWFVGISELGNLNLYGGIAYARVSRVVRSSLEIAAAATDPLTITNDNDTVAFWSFQEPPQIRDVGKHGIHMTERTLKDGIAPSGQDMWGVEGPNSLENAHQFLDRVSNYEFLATGPRQLLTNTFTDQNPYTLEAWVRPDQATTNHPLFHCGGAAPPEPESTADNVVVAFHLISAECALYALWEGGSDIFNYDIVTKIPAFSVPASQSGEFGRWYHLALRKRPVGNRYFWFFDGVDDYVTIGSPLSTDTWIFDGVDDQISISDVLDFDRLSPFSLSGWIKTSNTTQQTIIGKLQAPPAFTGYELGITGGKIFFLLISNFATVNLLDVRTTASVIPLNTLVHVTITYDGSSTVGGVKIYLNGISQVGLSTGGTLSGTTLSSAILTLGFRPASNSFCLSGQLSHAAIFDVELTGAQITEIYNGGTPPDLNSLPTAPDPVGWWKLNSLDTTAVNGVIDYGPSGFNGTALGGVPGMDTPQLNFERTDPFSIVVWIQTNVTGIAHLVGKTESDGTPGGYQFSINAAGQLVFRLENAAGQRIEKRVTTTSVASGGGVIRCCVVTYDGSSNASGVNIYTSGALQTMTTITNTLASGSVRNDKPFTIGRRNEIDQPYNGYIHGVSVFNRVLTLAEVVEANGGVVGTGRPQPDLMASSMAANLVGWWRFDQTDASSAGPIYTIADHSIFGSDGTTRGGLEPSLLSCSEYDFFSNGEIIETLPFLPDAKSGDIYAATDKVYSQILHSNSVAEVRWETRVSRVARTDNEILQSYLRGVETGVDYDYKMRAVDSGRPAPGYIYWVAGFPDFDATLVGTSIPTLIGSVVAGSVTEISKWEV